eukprot:331912-Pleurochrysis_carterae.AAC.1
MSDESYCPHIFVAAVVPLKSIRGPVGSAAPLILAAFAFVPSIRLPSARFVLRRECFASRCPGIPVLANEAVTC